MVITNNSPSSGFVSWSDLHVQFDGATYLIVDGNTDKIYSYWTPNTPNVLVCTNDFPTLAENEGLVLLNRTGVATVVPNATAIDGDLIVPGTITTKHLAAHSITADQMAVGSVNADSIQAKAITGDKIDAGTITADKLFIADRTNFAQFNPDSLPGENVVETVDGLNYFKMGPESYASLTYAISKVVDFSPGDEFSIKFTGFADAAITLLRAWVRYWYTDGTYSDAGPIITIPITTVPTLCSGVIKVTAAPTSGKTISYIRFFVEKGYGTTACYYLRNLSIIRRANGELIVDGSILAKHLASDSITTQKILANAITAVKLNIDDIFANSVFVNSIKTAIIRNLVLGGRNLMRGTSKEFADYVVGQYYVSITGLVLLSDMGLAPGDMVTLSMFLDNTANSVKGSHARITTYSTLAGADKTTFAGLENIIPKGTSGQSTLTVTLPATAVYLEVSIETDDSSITTPATTRMKCAKLEIGEMVTDWTPSPEELIIGSSIELREGHIFFEGNEMSFNVSGSNGDASLDEKGLTINQIVSPSVRAAFWKYSTIYVKKDADDGQVETGQYFRSLSAALIAMSGKYLSHWVSIVMTCADYYEGYISISGIAGGGTLKIFGNGSRLRATEIQFYDCALNISIDGIELYQRLATTHGIYADACNYLSLTNSKFYALSTTATNYGAITVAAGTGLYVNNCELYGVWRAILLRLSAHGVSYNNKGTASLSVSSGILIAEGTQPCASPTFGYSRGYGGVLEQSGTITVDQGAGATAPVVETETFAMTTVHTVYGTGDWPGTWMNETSYTWQGYTSTNKHEATLLWASGAAFAALAASNVTILEARLRIKRVSSIGVGDDVKVKAYYGSKSKTAGSGSPSSLVSIGSLGTISNGETAEFTIPTAAIKYLAGSPDGRCLALNPLDSSVLSGKSYSANYCKFYGLGGSVPELIVTYQTA